jgi:uncharacterized HAD superfamily protein
MGDFHSEVHKEKTHLRIGIDIDGVINNLERFHINYGTCYCYENNLPVLLNPTAYKLRQMYHIQQIEKRLKKMNL